MKQPAVQLQYGTGDGRRRWRHQNARLLALVLAGAGLVWLAIQYRPERRPDLWEYGPLERTADWRTARRCMAYAPPADHLVGEVGPSFSREWVTTGGRADTFLEESYVWFTARGRAPDCLSDLFRATRSKSWDAGYLTLLVHRMQPAGMPEQLVIVQHLPSHNDDAPAEPHGVLDGHAYRTRNGWSVPYRIYAGPAFPRLAPGRVLRLYAAQPDPADPAHFTYGYELDGKRGTADAWLRADGKLHWEVRDGPALGAPALDPALPSPGPLVAETNGHGAVTLHWQGVRGTDGYEVEWEPTNPRIHAPRRATVARGVNTASPWWATVRDGTTYEVRVRAWQGGRCSAWATLTFTTGNGKTTPAGQ